MSGEFSTLFYKETLRFWKVGFQPVAAPVLTAVLYLLIFSHVLDNHVRIHDVQYTAFLIPGLVMMSVTAPARVSALAVGTKRTLAPSLVAT